MTLHLPRKWLVVLVTLSALWTGWIATTHLTARPTLLDPVESVLVDYRVKLIGPQGPPEQVVIVAIDDRTVEAEDGYPLRRSRLAKLVSRVSEAGARAMAVDLLLVDAGASDEDVTLAAALSQLPTVIAAAGMFDDREQSAVPTTHSVLKPLSIFADVAKTGLVNVTTDHGGTPRHMPLIYTTSTGPTPSLALQAVSLFHQSPLPLSAEGVRVGEEMRRLDIGWHLPLRFLGPHGTIRTISALDVLEGRTPKASLNGKLVLVGATASGIGDRFNTPFDPIMPGVEVQATAMAQLLGGPSLVRDKTVRRVDVAVASLLAMAAILLVSFLPLTHAVLMYLALVAIWVLGLGVFFSQGYWLSATIPLAGSLPVILTLVLTRQVVDRRTSQKRLLAQQELSRFQHPVVAQKITGTPNFLAEPIEQEAAILFVDLAGFTGVSEQLGAARSRAFLKEFHTLVVEVTDRRNGLVLDFMGDGAMIGFGIPDASPKSAENALYASFELVEETQQWLAQADLGHNSVDLRIGAHTGTVVLSRLGHDQHQQIAATGDCVNVASRLEEIGKSLQANIVVSAALAEKVPLENLGFPVPDDRRTTDIRGRQQDLEIVVWKISRPD